MYRIGLYQLELGLCDWIGYYWIGLIIRKWVLVFGLHLKFGWCLVIRLDCTDELLTNCLCVNFGSATKVYYIKGLTFDNIRYIRVEFWF